MNEKNKNEKVEASEIETIEDLESCYPRLVSEVRDRVIEKIVAWPIEKIKQKLPGLYQRVEKQLGVFKGPDLSKPGFLLGEFIRNERGGGGKGDPFSESTLRFYARLKNLGIGSLELPFVLPFADVFTKEALGHYILVSEGGGDYERAGKARENLKKCK